MHRIGKLNNNYGLYEVVPGIYQVRGFDLAQTTFIRGKTGWIVFDCLVTADVMRAAWKLFQEHKGEGLPVSAVVYSHSHGDHFGGVRGVIDDEMVRTGKVKVIAKIENQQAITNIDALVETSGGIMIARGDLGSECPIEDLPIIQRQIVERCSYHGRKVIVATQMLESMIENPVPTRAEVTDVFNAVIEQVDCVMLNGETSIRRYPEKCVEVLDSVIRRIEEKYPSGRFASDAPLKTNKHKTVKAAITLANSVAGSKLLVFTLRGVMAHLLAHQRPEHAPIFAFTPHLHVSRALVSARGVHPFVMPFEEGSPGKSIHDALSRLRSEGLISPGDQLVILSDALYDGVNAEAILLLSA